MEALWPLLLDVVLLLGGAVVIGVACERIGQNPIVGYLLAGMLLGPDSLGLVADVGSIQALETIKLLLGLGDSLSGRILAIDTLEMSFRTFKLRPDPSNPVTWENRDKFQVRELDGLCAPWMGH